MESVVVARAGGGEAGDGLGTGASAVTRAAAIYPTQMHYRELGCGRDTEEACPLLTSFLPHLLTQPFLPWCWGALVTPVLQPCFLVNLLGISAITY